MMTDGMKEMMENGSFDSFAGNMSMMGAMIKGEGPEGMDEEGREGDFFASGTHDESMMTAMEQEMGDMSGAFSEMSEDQMGAFMEDMGTEGMADMAASMGMDMGDIDMSQMGGMDMGSMDMDSMDMGNMDMGAMSEMSESMGEAFGGSGDEGGMISEGGMSGGDGGGSEGGSGGYSGGSGGYSGN